MNCRRLMNGLPRLGAALAVLMLSVGSATAQDLVIRNATVHTATLRGTLKNTDVWISNGRIQALGPDLQVPTAVPEYAADGRPLTPALFAGITEIGLDEVSAEGSTVDHTAHPPAESAPLPEFDVRPAYNPASSLVAITRIEGYGFSLLGADNEHSFVGGQGGVIRLDGKADTLGTPILFLQIGGGLESGGKSRALQWLWLDQLAREAMGRRAPDDNVLSDDGRRVLKSYLQGQGRVAVGVDRAADIRRLLSWASAYPKLRLLIVGGAEAWQLAPELAAARIPVFVNPLDNLPQSFDSVGARADSALRLYNAGVSVGFAQSNDPSHNARKLRQLAGNAVAAGLPWEAALAGLTRIPAQSLGLGDELGTIEPGRRADLALWSGDPLDVIHTADQLWLDGRAVAMRSRQTELRDRYMHTDPQGWPPAYQRR